MQLDQRSSARRVFDAIAERLASSDGDPSRTLHTFITLLISTLLLSEASVRQQQPQVAFVAAVCIAGSLFERTRTAATRGALVLQGFRVWRDFPWTANHAYLQLVLLMLCALLATPASAQRHLLSSCRLIAAGVMFHAGLQKMLHGMYFDGRMLALLISKHHRYQIVFEPMIGADEVARLAGLNTHVAGSGPFLIDNALFIVVSNASWVAEIVIGILLLTASGLVPWVAAALIVAIEMAARETVFGIVMLGLFALSLPGRRARVALRLLVVFTFVACAAAYRVIPGHDVFFIEDGP